MRDQWPASTLARVAARVHRETGVEPVAAIGEMKAIAGFRANAVFISPKATKPSALERRTAAFNRPVGCGQRLPPTAAPSAWPTASVGHGGVAANPPTRPPRQPLTEPVACHNLGTQEEVWDHEAEMDQ